MKEELEPDAEKRFLMRSVMRARIDHLEAVNAELLTACEKMLSALMIGANPEWPESTMCHDARIAIAKAKGEKS